MKKNPVQIETKANGIVTPHKGKNPRSPYEHQRKAMHCLDILEKKMDSYSTLVVLPTGGGKTYTATTWLLRQAINRERKILWIAHRQLLLEQAAESFCDFAFSESIPNITSFKYRIISGSDNTDRLIDIKQDDDILIISKDTLGRNLDSLKKWLQDEAEIYFIIDEAHHSTAKTYRRIIKYLGDNVERLKLIGLTATPYRTGESEKGLLAKIYKNGVNSKKEVTDSGIAYQVGLKELIAKHILATPYFENCSSDLTFEKLGTSDWERIARLDTLPKQIANQIADSKERNRLIVNTYKKKRKEYGQTIVFVVNQNHAIALQTVFEKEGISSDYIISDLRSGTGANVSRRANDEKIDRFRKGEVEVLINVNIMTEGVDLPKTRTVFLARPTVSKTLMTQMVGRALRGVKANGTPDAHIVAFIDNWRDRIAWINPESLWIDEKATFIDKKKVEAHDIARLIAISKIKEFAALLDDTVDTSALENIPFEKRIPVGMYSFSFEEESMDEDGADIACQVMVYDSTADAYNNLMESMPNLFEEMEVTEEHPSYDVLKKMAKRCESMFFDVDMIPPYEEEDIIHILQFYAQKEDVPEFYPFEEITRKKLDVSHIANDIVKKKMSLIEYRDYVNELWEESDKNILAIFFPDKKTLKKQLDIEIDKILDPESYEVEQNVKYGKKELQDLPLYRVQEINPGYAGRLREGAFKKAKDKDGYYVCTICGIRRKSRQFFQVDHIKPLNKGGKTIPENLRILCASCNGRKGDKDD